MENPISYIKRLRFDEKLSNSLIAKYVTNSRLVILLVLGLLVAGAISFMQIPRVLNPDINIPEVIVTGVLPGASPSDVESLVTIPLEDAVRGVENVKTVTSTSSNSVGTIVAEFETGVDPNKAKADVQSAVDSVTNLPTDAQTPRVSKIDFQNIPVWEFVISSKSDLASLTALSNNLEKKLEDVPTIDNVTTTGIEKDEIQILIKPEAVSMYGINPMTLSSAIKSAVGSFPAGSVKTDNATFAVTIDPKVTSVRDLRDIIVNLNNTSVPLSDIAIIQQRSQPDQFPAYYAAKNTDIQRGITFNVYKRKNTTIEQSVADAEKQVNETLAAYPNQYELKTLLNTADEVQTQFNDLIRDLSITIVLIFITLLIFLGLRQAIVASLAVPLTFLMTFLVMNLTGIAFSFIAFFSLLLALGLLVDDTIVVISAMTAYHRTGRFTPLQTALLVWRDFVVAIFTTTITTVWAFLPLLLASGIIGEFIKPIPIVVSTTLLASFLVAMGITLPFIIFLFAPKIPRRVTILLTLLGGLFALALFYALIPKTIVFVQILFFAVFGFILFRVRKDVREWINNKTKQITKNHKQLQNLDANLHNGFIHFSVIERPYRRLLDRILSSKTGRRKTLIAVIAFSVFAYLLVPFGFVVNEFFPKSEANYVFVNVELPQGTQSDITKNETQQLMRSFKNLPSVAYVSASVGQFNNGGFGGGGGGSNTASFTLFLVEKSKRTLTSIDLAERIRTMTKNYQKGTITVVEESGGPPAGADLQINLYGDNLAALDQYANNIVTFLKKQPGVVDPGKSVKPGTGKLVFVPDSAKLADLGLNEQSLGLWLRTYASGFTLDSVKFDELGTDEKDITLRMLNTPGTPEGLSSIMIPTQQEGNIPLSSLGHLMMDVNPTQITRKDGKRTIAVSATVAKGYNTTVLNQKMEQYANKLNLPSGYSWSTGGANEENQKSVTSILQAMLLSFLLIIITMVMQFQSFRKAIIIMLVIPLSIAGVFIVFALTRTPLSFPALIGILALFGIVVKNSILIVDKISSNQKAGLPFKEAITDAATSRLEPIALTSIVAIIGLVPITVSDPLWRGLGGAIIAGLTFSGTIMLFFIPLVYWYWFNKDK
jgi:multidrug efflux pump subunit AcrB